MKPVALFAAGLFLLFTPPALAWDYDAVGESKEIYLEKLDLLKAMVQRMGKRDTMREMCLFMSIGIDVNERYLAENPDDAEEQERGRIMADQLTLCLGGMHLFQKTHNDPAENAPASQPEIAPKPE